MNDSRTTGRPWLAAALSPAVTGLGHLYLRRWVRAALWFAVVAATTVVVPQTAVDAAAAGERVDVVALAPLLLATATCALDASVVAARDTRRARDPSVDTDRCPHCGGELRTDLEFCHWCSTDVDAARSVEGGESR
ncbi:DUF7575 domain-containing protein [Halomarina oriensis]|uniref:Zinc ribbon domain-containing protein n=1 Tax=Halomarina oriensis TaxID=671145 RepID=A0A6B0GJS8_9EURY|nr:zinc ribbon domain-containing protein [Halomarina oriensis]MWG33063.1 zinc ribbon domain-containing protein [Halomarina oriensis]